MNELVNSLLILRFMDRSARRVGSGARTVLILAGWVAKFGSACNSELCYADAHKKAARNMTEKVGLLTSCQTR